jgi:hypothetical protein
MRSNVDDADLCLPPAEVAQGLPDVVEIITEERLGKDKEDKEGEDEEQDWGE